MYDELFLLQAELCKALAHPRRLEILQLLRDQELPVTDIHSMLDLPQANISQHLMILRDAQVLSTRRDGKQIFYQVADPRFNDLSDILREILIDQHRGSEVESHLQLAMKDLLPVVHDPVCQMRVSPKTAGATHTYQGHHYYFCASGCLKQFKDKPEAYVK